MQMVIKFKGGSLDGKQTLKCQSVIHNHKSDGTLDIYKLITVGQCKIPVRYKFIGTSTEILYDDFIK